MSRRGMCFHAEQSTSGVTAERADNAFHLHTANIVAVSNEYGI